MNTALLGQWTNSSSLSVGVLGVGNIGMVHLKSALAMPGVDVPAAADARPENRTRAERTGVSRTYDDYATLLESEDLDAAIVALPPFLHADAVEQAAAAGVDVFVEKPFARSTEEADRMLEAADDAGIAVGVDHTLRYQPDVVGVKETYEDGSVGHVPYATITRLNDGPLGRPPVTQTPPEWPLDSEAAGGGSLLELGIHCFDVLEWLFGDLEVQSATIGETLELPVEDAATVLIHAPETETTITLHCGSYQWEQLPEVNTRLRLEGVTGTISNEEYLPENFYASAAKSALANVASRVTGTDSDVFGPTFYLQAHYDALADFVDAVRNDERPPVAGEDGKRALEFAETAYETAIRSDQDEETVPEVTL
ncbi:Gfo/Idh/MocA family protein [Natrarchaeobius chitinivorans]|uniref:Gfo/Idh/MocA family oxidoreductase n=1 Tax=Natrarchaeobius chitinivorans TaxID=1679083 RepID=A0A3N6M1B7_NATCH|nr:Gfo/Idh/MocA family oxidoreductase [Natrarchaeobius chitinivorans]RQG97108.1 gfo/Idh/MocA family oxidoreductase [Natrarchaeobius chitinivorans]